MCLAYLDHFLWDPSVLWLADLHINLTRKLWFSFVLDLFTISVSIYLQDMIHNDGIELDWDFRFSLMNDIIKVR